MIVHLYSMLADPGVISIDMAINKIWTDPNRVVNHLEKFDICLDTCLVAPDRSYVAMDIIKKYDRGVGKVTQGKGASPIPLNAGEDFNNYTAAMYLFKEKILLLESNNSGARIGTIENYLMSVSGVMNKGYRFKSRDQDGVSDVIIKDSSIKCVELDANIVRLEKAGVLGLPINDVISQFLRQMRNSGAEKVKLKYSMRPKKENIKKGSPAKGSLDADNLTGVVDFVSTAMNCDPNAVYAEFKQSMKSNAVDSILTMSGTRWRFEEDVKPDSGGIRFPFDKRLQVLKNAMSAARRDGKI